ncbi:carbohydrate ABC transporter permease [Candidatus Galacturonibacter soehngenii]|uniref:Sugar ABC transporter permease n=1 Tax=Candidatus Galacturonatibacter soehngenii TaxID=2307010 RepID=A0A7V7QK65_9FIRM|nr:sugar ABC transporter permease [Candidatus Galacturonibacter soehngenii]KAB1438157.1 sugar ABC transporter permease [Candidatus Galacturonibacter soehngenii]MBA4687192.1 sugar ABC transporter permease [Candidatus Galacturonibacter soehngenii]
MKNFEQKIFPYLLLLPTIAIFGVFLFYPAVNGLWISFTKWDGINPQKFIGLKNYVDLLSDESFWRAFLNTVVFTVITVPAIYVSALFLALLLTQNIKGSSFFRAAFYWPTMVSTIIVGLSWRFLLGEDFGIINYLLTAMGRSPVKWLTNPRAAMGVIIFVTTWSLAGYYMVMFIAGIKSISETYYEAAKIDGAGFVQQFRYITLPLLKPTTLLVIVLSTVTVIKTYPLVFALTQGGPAGATKLMVQLIQETGFDKNKMGYASAMTMFLFIILAVLTTIQFKLNQGGEQDEN